MSIRKLKKKLTIRDEKGSPKQTRDVGNLDLNHSRRQEWYLLALTRHTKRVQRKQGRAPQENFLLWVRKTWIRKSRLALFTRTRVAQLLNFHWNLSIPNTFRRVLIAFVRRFTLTLCDSTTTSSSWTGEHLWVNSKLPLPKKENNETKHWDN